MGMPGGLEQQLKRIFPRDTETKVQLAGNLNKFAEQYATTDSNHHFFVGLANMLTGRNVNLRFSDGDCMKVIREQYDKSIPLFILAGQYEIADFLIDAVHILQGGETVGITYLRALKEMHASESDVAEQRLLLAIDHFRQDPEIDILRLLLGESWMFQSDYEKAYAILDNLKESPYALRANLGRAFIHYKHNDYSEAESLVDKLRNSNVKEDGAVNDLAIEIKKKLRKTDEAIDLVYERNQREQDALQFAFHTSSILRRELVYSIFVEEPSNLEPSHLFYGWALLTEPRRKGDLALFEATHAMYSIGQNGNLFYRSIPQLIYDSNIISPSRLHERPGSVRYALMDMIPFVGVLFNIDMVQFYESRFSPEIIRSWEHNQPTTEPYINQDAIYIPLRDLGFPVRDDAEARTAGILGITGRSRQGTVSNALIN